MKTWTFIDRSDPPWGEGPWDSEPDKAEWRDKASGLACIARRGPGGHWCGYVAVAPGHPWHGVGYHDCPHPTKELITTLTPDKEWVTKTCDDGWCDHRPEHLCDVHGGLTYAGPCMDGDKEHGVCHTPAEGENDDVWWFGFDCHHAWDYAPAHEARMRTIPAIVALRDEKPDGLPEDVYRPLSYVVTEVTRLAATLAAVSAPVTP